MYLPLQALCLIENGAIVDQARDDGSTAMHDACALGNPDIVKLLIKNGAEVNKKDSTGTSMKIKLFLLQTIFLNFFSNTIKINIITFFEI